MADPVTMTLMAVGTGMQAYGQYQQGQSAKAAGKYNQAVAYREAQALDVQAEQEVAAGTFNAQRIAKRSEEILSEMRAKAASGGQSAQDASVVALAQETVKNTTLDQLIEMAGAEERAQQIKHSGVVRRSQGDYAKYQGGVAAKAANLAAATTLVQGGASWMQRFGTPSSSGSMSGSVSSAGSGVANNVASAMSGYM
jgi:parvulin-like peptidyl-prolyl isomerase